ncbi:MAG: TolC family protein, partial [Deltaproteobacteria bacterium]
TRSAFLQKELTLRQRLIDTDTEVRRKRIELSSAREQLDHARKALTLSEEAHRLAEELYAEGVADALSVLDAQTALFNAQIALARAKTGYAYAYLALELALGEFPPEG